jgi:SMI1 / KNR4 family (SUKH-1)
MTTDAALERIAEKLRRVRGSGAEPFGAESHGMRVNPPLSPEAVAAVEARLGVVLPEEYRAFITRIGDGGAGPAYGMFSLEQALRATEVHRVPDLLAQPFRHVEAYDPETDPEWNAFWDRVDEGGVSEEEQDLFGVREQRGALMLCHEGCGYMHMLVVTGPARGTMWMDGRCSDYGFSPFNVTFLEWYERWLDDVLAGGRGTWWFGPPVYPAGAG